MPIEVAAMMIVPAPFSSVGHLSGSKIRQGRKAPRQNTPEPHNMAMLKPTGLLLATLASASASAAAASGLPVGAIGRGGYPRAIEMARGERLLCTGEGGGLRVAAGQLACMLHAQHHSRVLPDWLRRATSSPLVRSCMSGARYQVTGLASLFWPALGQLLTSLHGNSKQALGQLLACLHGKL
jgi:hypothetical protein